MCCNVVYMTYTAKSNQVTCPHGIACDYVYTYTTIQGEQYVTGGEYWHDPETRCTKTVRMDTAARR